MMAKATLFAFALTLTAGLGALAQGVPDYAAVVAAPDRSEADRTTDKRRNPVKLLAFTGVKAGMTALDMGAGAGYSTELMARAVGQSGKVYGQNSGNFARAIGLPRNATRRRQGRTSPLVRPFDVPCRRGG
jgi:predicted methyltransferase